MDTKKITYCGKLIEVPPEVHRAYETATTAIKRNNKKFHENETTFAKIYKTEPVSFEKQIEDKLLVEQIFQVAAEHLSEDEYIIFEKIICNGEREREYARSLGIPQKTLNNRKLKIVEKLKKILKS